MALTDSFSKFMPTGISGNSIVNTIAWIIIVGLIASVIGAIIYFLYTYVKFDKKIIVFEKIGSEWVVSKKDRAMETKMGEGGDTVFYTKKFKKYLPSPRIQMGKKTYWFFIREDGEWINFKLKDLDQQMRAIDAHFLDKEMRYARVALQRNLRDRYQKSSFLEKYGGLIAYTALIAVTGIMMWLLFDKFLDITGSAAAAVDAADKVLQETKRVIGALDSLSGSGVSPA